MAQEPQTPHRRRAIPASAGQLRIGHLSEHSPTSGTVGIGSGNVAGTRRDAATALAVRGDREVS
jgi:hypothetical protein